MEDLNVTIEIQKKIQGALAASMPASIINDIADITNSDNNL